MHVLVSGGAGFIGSHTAEALLVAGHEVTLLDNLQEPVHRGGRAEFAPHGARLMHGDVRVRQDWERALDSATHVLHLAAYQDYLPDFGTFFHTNAVGTALLYEVVVARGLPIEKIVVASSQAAYGEGRYQCAEHGEVYPDIRSDARLRRGLWDHVCPACGAWLEPQPTPEGRVNPQNQYAISKYTQELIALSLGTRYGLPTTCLRYSIVQGPRQSFYNAYSGACRIFALSLFFGRPPVIYEDGRQLRDYVNIADVVRANLLAIGDTRTDGRVFNVGGGRVWTVLEFYEMAQRVFGSDLRAQLPGEYRFGDTRHIESDVTALRALGWTPTRSPEESLVQYRDWLRELAEVPDVLEDAAARMRSASVVRRADPTGARRTAGVGGGA